MSTRSTTSTTTRTTTLKSNSTVGKKPSEVSHTTITKTKGVTARVPPKQNGVHQVNVVQEITTAVVMEQQQPPQLLKDNSPVEAHMDNSLLDAARIE